MRTVYRLRAAIQASLPAQRSSFPLPGHPFAYNTGYGTLNGCLTLSEALRFDGARKASFDNAEIANVVSKLSGANDVTLLIELNKWSNVISVPAVIGTSSFRLIQEQR